MSVFLRFLPLFAFLFLDGVGGGGDGGGSGDAGGDAGGDKGGGSGKAGGDAGSGGGTGTGSGNGGDAGGSSGDGAPEGRFVPYDRFKEVNDELARRKAEDQARADDEATKKGEFEKVKSRLEGENGGLRATLESVALRNAFYTEASGKATNLRLAYIAASEAGLLDNLKVEIDVEKRHAEVTGDVKTIVEKVLKDNPELKGTSRSFGDPKGGQGPADGIEADKLSPAEKMSLAYRQGASRR